MDFKDSPTYLQSYHNYDDIDINYSTGNSTYARFLSTEFFADMKRRLAKAKQIWDKKMNDLKTLLNTLQPSNSKTILDSYDEVFNTVLMLFTMELVGDNASVSIEDKFENYPEQVIFYIPQLAVFLLYGSFETSRMLQISILDICEKSLVFSHKLYWFINAFSLSEAGVTQEGVIVLRQLMTLIEQHGNQSSSYMKNQIYAPSEISQLKANISLSHHSADKSSKHVIHIHEGNDEEQKREDIRSSYSSVGPVIKEGILLTNFNEELRPPSLTITSLRPPGSASPSSGGLVVENSTENVFRKEVVFWDSLVGVSRKISTINASKRTLALRDLLLEFNSSHCVDSTDQALTADSLPMIYIPVGNPYHR
jgi:hypothetical protein